MTELSDPQSSPRPWWRWLGEICRKPIIALPLLIWLCREVQEFYPFSHFPMYSDPRPVPQFYVYLGDADKPAEGGLFEPVAMQHAVGMRAAKAKKVYQDKLRTANKKLGREPDDYLALPADEKRKIGEDLLAYFRKRKEIVGDEAMPDRMALIEVTVNLLPGEPMREEATLIATEP
ncbi:MAG: hypothetical protein R3F11_02435 [Verrucomicrobiales bacterium]